MSADTWSFYICGICCAEVERLSRAAMPAFRPGIGNEARFLPTNNNHFSMRLYRRRLPHWQPSDRPLFLTWQLHGSLPKNRFPPAASESAGKAIVWMDRYLYEVRTGPTWLQRPEIAQLVLSAIEYAERPLQLYDLHAWVIMSNHVHVLVAPHAPAARFLKSVKGFTAREANRLLQRLARHSRNQNGSRPQINADGLG